MCDIAGRGPEPPEPPATFGLELQPPHPNPVPSDRCGVISARFPELVDNIVRRLDVMEDI